MSGQDKIHIIGVGDDGLDGLTPSARSLVEAADLLIGDEKTLVPSAKAEQFQVGTNFDSVVERIQQAEGERIVVMASGDPLFFGVARHLCDRLGDDRFEVIPHVSSMQLAFARVKQTWDEAYLANLAVQSLEHVVEKVRTIEKAGLFTTESVTPAKIAKALLDRNIDYFSAYVCENLGSPDERVTKGSLEVIGGQAFAPRNVMVLVRDAGAPDRPIEGSGQRLFGNPDEAFLQSKPKTGLLTPAEIRAMALSELDLGSANVVWDVGAGSGSVAVEAARIARGGTVYAIERDGEDIELIRSNADKFGAFNLTAVHGSAPEAWSDLPDPDAVFVGGTGREVATIAAQAYERLASGGRLVVHVASMENVTAVRDFLDQSSCDVKVLMINLARSTYQLERVRFDALNPSFLLSAVKS